MWLLTALVPVALYIVRPRARRQRVSTLLFFKSLAKEHQESAWLRQLKRLLSLLLSLLILAGAGMALARLVAVPRTGTIRSAVILIDRSASMSATDSGAVTRLDAAKRAAVARLTGMHGGVAVSVVTYDSRPTVLLPRSMDRREIERAILSIGARPIEGRPEEALHLSEQLARIEAPASIWHYTDAPAPESIAVDSPVTIEHVCVALRSPTNVGITAFELRRSPMQRDQLEAFAQLVAVGPGPVEAQVQMRRGQNLIAVRRMTIEPGGRELLAMPIEAGEASGSDTLSLSVRAEGDSLRADNELLARVPQPEPIEVLWISAQPDVVTQFALQSLGRDTQVRVFAGGPNAWPSERRVDVVVFQGWLPETWPQDVPVIAIDPDRSVGPVRIAPVAGGGLPVDAPRTTQAHHPVLFGVAGSRVSLLQKTVLDADPARSGLEPLWVGPAGPLLAVGEVRGQRVVIMSFSAAESENLWRLPSYPLLIGNAIYWATLPAAATITGNNRRCGELLATHADTIIWSSPDIGMPHAGKTAIVGRWTELDHVGLWSTDAGESGSAALLSAEETRLPSHGDADGLAVSARGWSRWLSGDMTAALLWVVLATLMVESWLFHLHSVY